MPLEFHVFLFKVLNHIALLRNLIQHLTFPWPRSFKSLLLDSTLYLLSWFDVLFELLVFISQQTDSIHKFSHPLFVIFFSYFLLSKPLLICFQLIFLLLKFLVDKVKLTLQIRLHKTELLINFSICLVFFDFFQLSNQILSLMDLSLPTTSQLFIVTFQLNYLYQLLLTFLW